MSSLLEILRDNHEATYLTPPATPDPSAGFFEQYLVSRPDARSTNRVPQTYVDPTMRFESLGSDTEEENRRRRGYAALPLSGVSGAAAAQLVRPVSLPPDTPPATPPHVPSVAGQTAGQSGGPTVPPSTVPTVPPSTVPPSTVPGGQPRIFPTSAGLPGGYNMGNDPRFVPTDAQGVPIGQQMVPVRGLSGGTASIGMNPDVGPLPSSVPMRPDAGIMPPTLGQAPDFGYAAVLRASPQETAQLKAWRTQGRTLEQQDSITARLKEFEQGQQAANASATRQIAVAQGTPQVAAGGAGNVAWDPNANDGTGGVVSDVRLPNEVRSTQADPQTVRIKQIKDLTSAYRAMIPHLDPMTEWQMQAELSKEQDPAKKRAIMQKYGVGEQSDQALAVLAQLAQLTAPEAGQSAAPSAPAAAAAAPSTAGTPPPAGSVAAKYLRK
jgi:hypothetical protein